MPFSYTLVVRREFKHEGREFAAGEVIGSVASEIPWGTIHSVCGAADRVVAIADDELDDDATDATDPTEELLASSDLDAAIEADDRPVPSEPIDPSPGDDLAQMGLSPKIVETLVGCGIETAEALLDFVASGGDLLDLDGIKKADKTKILAALKV